MCQRCYEQALFLISLRLKVRNIVKNPPVLHLHGGVLEDRLESGYILDVSEMPWTNFIKIEGQEHRQEPPVLHLHAGVLED